MALKEYWSRRWPQLGVGGTIKFKDGVYRTEDEDEQKLIESLPYFGTLVWEEKNPPEAVEFVEPPAAVEAESTSKRGGKWRVK